MEQEIISGLVARGVPLHIAQGMVANMIAESGLNPGVNEVAPLVEGSRGGYGLNQWTGPRRRAFESYAAERGVSPSDLNTQLDFTMAELQGPEQSAWAALQGAQSPTEAARIYSEKFLRPGIPHMDRRIAEAARLGGMEYKPQGQPAPVMAQQMPQQPEDPYKDMGIFSEMLAKNGIYQSADAAPIANIWYALQGRKEAPQGGILGFLNG